MASTSDKQTRTLQLRAFDAREDKHRLFVAQLKQTPLTIQQAIDALIKLYLELYVMSVVSINNGFCELFAVDVCMLIPGAEAFWGDELMSDDEDEDLIDMYAYHCFVAYDGRYYDAEVPFGCNDWRGLPSFNEIR